MGLLYSNSMLVNCIVYQESLIELLISQKYIVNNKLVLGYVELNIESRYILGKLWVNLNVVVLLKDVFFMYVNISFYKSIFFILNILKIFLILF